MSEYPHDREWEISPEERSRRRRRKHLEPPDQDQQLEPEHPDARADGQLQPQSESKFKPQSQSCQHQQQPPAQQMDENTNRNNSSLIGRLLHAIFAPLIGFVVIALVTLVWSAFLVGVLIALGPVETLSMTTIGAAVVAWIIGMGAFQKVLLTP